MTDEYIKFTFDDQDDSIDESYYEQYLKREVIKMLNEASDISKTSAPTIKITDKEITMANPIDHYGLSYKWPKEIIKEIVDHNKSLKESGKTFNNKRLDKNKFADNKIVREKRFQKNNYTVIEYFNKKGDIIGTSIQF